VIPVEPDRRPRLGGEVLLPDAHGACVFYDRPSKLCTVHRDYGDIGLPDSCFHFPRRALVDDRGVFVTLSHFCPTAAALVVSTTERPAIVEAPPAFPASRRYDGLDGRGAWPPLVRPNLLFDLASYTRWESYVIDTLGDSDVSTAVAVARLADAAELLRMWTPAMGSLEDAVAALTVREDLSRSPAIHNRYSRFQMAETYNHILEFIPDGLRRPPPANREASLSDWDWAQGGGAAKRYLAAKAFGSWAAYEARGVRTLVAELIATELVLKVEVARIKSQRSTCVDEAMMIDAVRAADWLLVHLVDRTQMMRWLGQVEDDQRS